jgi:hypothetical protein
VNLEERGPYEFLARGLLAEAALDNAGRVDRHLANDETGVRAALHFDLLDSADLDVSLRMANIYAAITAFERSARRFIAKVLQGAYGENWWDQKVSAAIRNAAEQKRTDEDQVKWHGTRGDDPLTYTEMTHLAKIIQQNWVDFEPYILRADWAEAMFSTISRSRNVIMHSGVLDKADIERLGMSIRDWVTQVGS